MVTILKPSSGWSIENSQTPGAVGSYMFCVEGFTSRSLGFGGTIAGSELSPASCSGYGGSFGGTNGNVDQEDWNHSGIAAYNNWGLPGTWRCMGNGTNYSATSNSHYVNNATLWVRIS